jgi:hypothetical protein
MAAKANRRIAKANSFIRIRQHHDTSYQRECDERKCPICGFWIRNDWHNAQPTLEHEWIAIKIFIRRVLIFNGSISALHFLSSASVKLIAVSEG